MTIFSTAAADILSLLGTSATFTPATGSPVEGVNVVVDLELLMQPGGYNADAYAQYTTIECLLSDLPHEPNRNESFSVSGTVYNVDSVLENDGLFVKVIVHE